MMRAAPRDYPIYSQVLSEIASLSANTSKEFWGTVAFFLGKRGVAEKISERVSPDSLAGWQELLDIERSQKKWGIHFYRVLLLFLAFVYLFPSPRGSLGAEFLVLGKQVTVSNLAFFSLSVSLLLGFFEVFQFHVSKQARLKFCLGTAVPSTGLSRDSLTEMRDHGRGIRVPMAGWIVESYVLDLVFLAGLLVFSLLLGWLIPLFYGVLSFSIYFILPGLLIKIRDSRLFLRIQLVGTRHSSRAGRFLLWFLLIGVFTQLLGGLLFFLVWIPALPHLLQGFPITIILQQAVLINFIAGLLFLGFLRSNPLPQRSNLRLVTIFLLLATGLFSLVLSGSFSGLTHGLSYSLAGIMMLALGLVRKMIKGV